MRILLAVPPVVLLAVSVGGCGSGGSSSRSSGSTAGGISPTASSGRDPMGYDWSSQSLPGSVVGERVSALAATDSSSFLAAHAPQRAVQRFVAGVPSTEGGFAADVVGFANDGALAACADTSMPDAGDVYMHGPMGWAMALDGTRGAAAVAATGSQAWAFVGDATGGPAEVHVRDASGTWSMAGSLPSSGVPSAATVHAGEVWVGVGPEVALFRGDVSFALVPAPFAKVAGAGQRVSALLSTPRGLAVAVAASDSSGNAAGGEVLLWDGAGFQPVASFPQDAPLALAWQDGTIYVGTAAGRLVFVDSMGGIMDEPGLPANLGVHALATPDSTTLLVGVAGVQGAEVLVRVGRSHGATGGGTGVAAGPDYVNDVKPILQAKCVVCHAPMATPYKLSTGLTDDAADHAATVAEVDLAAPDMSKLLRKATNADAHGGGASITDTSAEYGTLLAWIRAGAPLQAASGTGSGAGTGSGTGTATPPPPPPPPAAGTPDYLRWAKPVLLARCVGCHAPMNTPYKLSTGMTNDQADYTATKNLVDLTTPANSRLLRKATNMDAHAGGPTLQAGGAEYNQLLSWIQGGAQFMTAGGTPPPPPMVPANPTYLADIKPILGSCVGCHVREDDFRLSAGLANDTADYQRVLSETNTTTPTNSSFLRHATRMSEHPVKVFDVGSLPYDTFVKWVQQGRKFQ